MGQRRTKADVRGVTFGASSNIFLWVGLTRASDPPGFLCGLKISLFVFLR